MLIDSETPALPPARAARQDVNAHAGRGGRSAAPSDLPVRDLVLRYCGQRAFAYQLPPALQPPVLTGAQVRVTVELVFVIV